MGDNRVGCIRGLPQKFCVYEAYSKVLRICTVKLFSNLVLNGSDQILVVDVAEAIQNYGVS